MSSSARKDSTETIPEGSSLDRRALQKRLKSWGLKAGGKTEALRSAYDEARKSRIAAAAAGKSDDAAVAEADATGQKIEAEKEATPEKRARRFRSMCSAAVNSRIQRAKTQRLYLIRKEELDDLSWKFAVLGSTGNIYDVNICKVPDCSCPDHAKGNLCKHILFVMLKVIGVRDDSFLVYQVAYLESELKEMFDKMKSRRVGGSVMANTTVQETYAKLEKGEAMEDANEVKRQALEPGCSDCPICFDEMKDESGLTFCRAMCGANFHADCIRHWIGHGEGTCPNCRQPWEEETTDKKSAEGYTNLGKLQGQSKKRDTSTYDAGFVYWKRRRHEYE